MVRDLLKIIQEQKRELEELLCQPVLKRRPAEKIDVFSPLAQVVLGMRRSGKSVVCRTALKQAGVKFGYVDFDDEILARLNVEDLDGVLGAVYAVYGDVDTFFFDELQNIDGWHLFVNRLLRAGKHLVITGSNARLLEDDLATHLTGRYLPVHVQPFSFGEFRQWIGHRADASTEKAAEDIQDWKRYFAKGGLPETFVMPDARGYVKALYDSVISKDILRRHQVRNVLRFQDAAYVVVQQFAREISYENLARAAGVASVHTMQTYVGYLAESYLVSTVRHYSPKPSERIRNEKIYVGDPAFITYFTGVTGSEEELGWRLENIVYLELLRNRYDEDYEIFYYRDQSYDIDFCLVRHGKIVALIQVAYTISGEKTRRREVPPLLGAGRKTGCSRLLLITDHERETIVNGDQTVEVLPAPEFLEGNRRGDDEKLTGGKNHADES